MTEIHAEPLPDHENQIWWWFADQKRRWLVLLEMAGITTIADLKQASDADLLKIKGLGKRALRELRELQQ